jgi:membrane protein YdbS with pleckstrin-like domain
MTGHRRLLTRPWILLMAVAILIAGHGIVLYYASSHTTLSAAVLTSVIIFVVIKHLGLFGALFALFRHRSRH